MQSNLIRMLQNAYSGELAAYYAYEGHWRSVRNLTEKTEIQGIQREELEHRTTIGEFLSALGAKPNPRREVMFTLIGRTISFLCYLGGWFIPMYGAGKLERGNIVEYEIAAREAARVGCTEMIEPLLQMAEIEWDHEFYFRNKCQDHWLTAVFKIWPAPPARTQIRTTFYEELADLPVVEPRPGNC